MSQFLRWPENASVTDSAVLEEILHTSLLFSFWISGQFDKLEINDESTFDPSTCHFSTNVRFFGDTLYNPNKNVHVMLSHPFSSKGFVKLFSHFNCFSPSIYHRPSFQHNLIWNKEDTRRA